jgi:hypothetical protein
MKFGVINLSGNVGKTTIARDLLSYRLNEHQIISIESINTDGGEDLVFKGESAEDIFVETLLIDDYILDVGCSNVEDFLLSYDSNTDIVKGLDFILVPTTPETKQQMDTIKTVFELINLEIPTDKIKVILNQTDPKKSLDVVFSDLENKLEQLDYKLDYRLNIQKHDLYSTGLKLSQLITDTDYLAEVQKAKKESDPVKARAMAVSYAKQIKANDLNSTYQNIYDIITNE